MAENSDKEVIRSPSGQFVKGVSGNPKGRPKGIKNRITELKEEVEVVVRETVTPERIRNVFEAMYNEALAGNVQAGKLILDKFITNAKEAKEGGEEAPEITIRIRNLTGSAVEVEEAEIIDQEDDNG